MEARPLLTLSSLSKTASKRKFVSCKSKKQRWLKTCSGKKSSPSLTLDDLHFLFSD